MSPEPLPETLPVRASPSDARRASRFNWCGSSGASVATTMMIEPVSCFADRAVGDLPTDRHAGDAQLVAQAVVGLHQHADGVAAALSQTGARRCRCRP